MAALDHIDHVGSLVRPQKLIEKWKERDAGKATQEQLTALTDELVRDVVKFQEGLGLKVVTDGEYRRGAWANGFMAAVDGLVLDDSPIPFQDDEGNTNPAPGMLCVSPLKRKRSIVADDFRFLKSIATVRGKVTMPSPGHHHFTMFDKSFEGTYPNRDAYFEALASIYHEEFADLSAAGCDFVQIDDVSVPVLCDARVQAMARKAGLEPDTLFDAYINAFNQAVSAAPASMTVAMHVCRGNQAGRWMGDGAYDPVADRIFNTIVATRYLMEYDSPRAGDFTPLRFLPKGKIAYLGIVSTKNPTVESKDALVRRIEEASKIVPIEQLGLTTQCGFGTVGTGANTDRPNPMTEDVQKSKLERMVEVAQDVWG